MTNTRIINLGKQLNPPFLSLDKYRIMNFLAKKTMKSLLYSFVEEQEQLFMELSRDSFFLKYKSDISNENYSEIDDKILLIRFFSIIKASYSDYKLNKKRYSLLFQALFSFEESLGAILSIDFWLYIQTIETFGSSKHINLLERAFLLEDIGLFIYSDSNIKVTYDILNKDFQINSDYIIFNNKKNLKIYNKAVIFARLFIDETDKGLQVFVFDINNDQKGLEILENQLKFTNYFINFDSLLDNFIEGSLIDLFEIQNKISINTKFSVFAEGHEYVLSLIRINLIEHSVIFMEKSLAISIRFSALRRQFGSTKPFQEIPILSYPLIQYRLIVLLSKNIIFRIFINKINDIHKKFNNFIHFIYAGAAIQILKEINLAIKEAREICGGFGYSDFSKIGDFFNKNLVLESLYENYSYVEVQIANQLIKKLDKNDFKTKNNEINAISSKEIRKITTIEGFLKLRLQNAIDSNEKSEIILDFVIDYVIFNEILRIMSFLKEKTSQNIIKKCLQVNYLHKILKSAQYIQLLSLEKPLEFIKAAIISLTSEISLYLVDFADIFAQTDEVLDSAIASSEGKMYEKFMQKVLEQKGSMEKPYWWPEIFRKKND